MSAELVLQMLRERGVTAESIAEIVLQLQKPYNKALTTEVCLESVITVLAKREVQYTLMTGIALDELAERKLLPEPLQSILEADEPLYGVDETLALGIVHVYGMIGLTSFGSWISRKSALSAILTTIGRRFTCFSTISWPGWPQRHPPESLIKTNPFRLISRNFAKPA